MQKPWLSQYNGVSEFIDLERFNSIPAIFDSAFARFKDRPMAINGQIHELRRV